MALLQITEPGQAVDPHERKRAAGIDLGRRVLHQVFGEGVVTQFEGQGSNARVEVSFSEGSKWLVLQYANLTIL